MTDERSLTWTRLLPADAGYSLIGAPPAFRDLLTLANVRHGEDVLCVWAPRMADLSRISIDRFRALALVNPCRVPVMALTKSGFRHVRRYAVLPSLADARWFVPRDNVLVSEAALHMYAPYRLRARLLKLGAELAIRMRLPLWHADELIIAAREPLPLERTLAKPFREVEIRLAFSSGTPGPARKPVFQILRPNGHILGYAKLGITAATACLIRREAGLLRSLSANSRVQGFAPALLFEGDVHGMPVTVQTAVSGNAGPVQPTSMHRRLLAALRREERRPVAASHMFRNMERRVLRLANPVPAMSGALKGVRPVAETLTLPVSIVHGDFAPWNLRMQGGELRAFDWEYGEIDGIPLVDELHHDFQVGFLLRGWDPEQALTYLRSVQVSNRMGLQAEQVAALQVVYLLDVCSRRLEAGHSPDDEWNRRYLRLIPALSRFLLADGARS